MRIGLKKGGGEEWATQVQESKGPSAADNSDRKFLPTNEQKPKILVGLGSTSSLRPPIPDCTHFGTSELNRRSCSPSIHPPPEVPIFFLPFSPPYKKKKDNFWFTPIANHLSILYNNRIKK